MQKWTGILIAVLIIGNIFGWSAYSDQQDQIKEYRQQVKNLRWKIGQLQDEIDRKDYEFRILEDDLRALGYRPVDLSTIKMTKRSHTFAAIARDSRFWNKRQDVDKFLEALLSGRVIISGYDIDRVFDRGGTWNAIDLTKSYWEKLKDNGIISVIAVGNLDLHGETLSESNHSWLLVFYKDWGKDGWSKTEPLGTLIFEPTQRYSFVIHIAPEASTQYQEGYFYTSPFDLEADIKERR